MILYKNRIKVYNAKLQTVFKSENTIIAGHALSVIETLDTGDLKRTENAKKKAKISMAISCSLNMP